MRIVVILGIVGIPLGRYLHRLYLNRLPRDHEAEMRALAAATSAGQATQADRAAATACYGFGEDFSER